MLEGNFEPAKDVSVAGALASKVEIMMHSAAYAGVAEPLKGLAQLGGSRGPDWLSRPKEAEFGSSDWYAQQAGNALGMAFDFWLINKAVGGGANLAKAEGLAGSVGTRAALSGAAYEGILRPVDDNRNPYRQRIDNAVTGAATFLVLAKSSSMMAALGRSTDGSISRLVTTGTGVLAGMNAGLVNAEVSSFLAGRGGASGNDVLKNSYTFMVGGAMLGAVRSFDPTTDTTSNDQRSERAIRESLYSSAAPVSTLYDLASRSPFRTPRALLSHAQSLLQEMDNQLDAAIRAADPARADALSAQTPERSYAEIRKTAAETAMTVAAAKSPLGPRGTDAAQRLATQLGRSDLSMPIYDSTLPKDVDRQSSGQRWQAERLLTQQTAEYVAAAAESLRTPPDLFGMGNVVSEPGLEIAREVDSIDRTGAAASTERIAQIMRQAGLKYGLSSDELHDAGLFAALRSGGMVGDRILNSMHSDFGEVPSYASLLTKVRSHFALPPQRPIIDEYSQELQDLKKLTDIQRALKKFKFPDDSRLNLESLLLPAIREQNETSAALRSQAPERQPVAPPAFAPKLKMAEKRALALDAKHFSAAHFAAVTERASLEKQVKDLGSQLSDSTTRQDSIDSQLDDIGQGLKRLEETSQQLKELLPVGKERRAEREMRQALEGSGAQGRQPFSLTKVESADPGAVTTAVAGAGNAPDAETGNQVPAEKPIPVDRVYSALQTIDSVRTGLLRQRASVLDSMANFRARQVTLLHELEQAVHRQGQINRDISLMERSMLG